MVRPAPRLIFLRMTPGASVSAYETDRGRHTFLNFCLWKRVGVRVAIREIDESATDHERRRRDSAPEETGSAPSLRLRASISRFFLRHLTLSLCRRISSHSQSDAKRLGELGVKSILTDPWLNTFLLPWRHRSPKVVRHHRPNLVLELKAARANLPAPSIPLKLRFFYRKDNSL